MGKAEEAALEYTREEDFDDPPPPYSPAPYLPPSNEAAADGDGSEKQVFQKEARSGDSLAGPSTQEPLEMVGQFPRAFNLYRIGTFSLEHSLGVHKNQPLYAISIHIGWSGKPSVILYNGTSIKGSHLASVKLRSMGFSFSVKLPPTQNTGSEGLDEPVEAIRNGLIYNFRFSVEVNPQTGEREQFEWRSSQGEAVSSLDGERSGWKLLRMATVPQKEDATAATRSVGAGYMSSDGKEVVAVWTQVGLSVTKSAKFQFLGTGTSGIFGERWALMVVMTALGLYETERRLRE
jgi:hypothetical protein